MNDKSLKKKAINIKGKKYVLVSDRVQYFNETYPDGSIRTDLVSEWSSDYIVVKATVLPDSSKPEHYYTGYSQATVGDGMVNKTAALENTETSAVGRALGMMGIGVIESIASADEMAKTTLPAKPRYIAQKQAELLINKVKWGLKEYDPDTIVGFIDNAVGQDFTKLTQAQMDVAIEQVDDAIKRDKALGLANQKTPEQVEAEEKELESILDKVGKNAEVNLEELPY